MTTRHSTTVAIVGAGASGTLVAIQLLRRAESAGSPIDIRLIDPAPTTGRGVAYSTDDPQLLLNVRASKMGAVASEPDHFCRWLERTKQACDPGAYVPRGWFGEYLEQSLGEAMASSTSRLHRVAARVTDIRRRDFDSTVRLDNGDGFRASHVVLALGSPTGVNESLPASLLRSTRFVTNPLAPGALEEVADGPGDVLVLGTGLTMVDVATTISRPGRRVTAVSRRGLIPASHVADSADRPEPPPIRSGALSLEQVERLVGDHLERATRAGFPWQHAIDSLRPVTNELWGRLGPLDQERFVTGPMRTWEVARHRIAPEVADNFKRLVDTGAVTTGAGEVVATFDDAHDGIEVVMADATTLRASWVISCTGATPLRSATGPLAELVGNLENQGAVVAHPLGMGLLVDEVGRAVDAIGKVTPAVYVVGPLRRGRLWETTAIPEILAQSDEVARHVVRSDSESTALRCREAS